mgnify:CR=1 FL=1
MRKAWWLCVVLVLGACARSKSAERQAEDPLTGVTRKAYVFGCHVAYLSVANVHECSR